MIYDANPPVLPGHSVVGTCSICRGAVVTPTMWFGETPPTRHCVHCGAREKPQPKRPTDVDYGPVVPMEKGRG